MSTVKIEHANPATAHPIAFDIMAAPRKDAEGHAIEAVKNPDGTATYPDGTVVTLDRDGNEVRETLILAPGHFRIIELSGGLMLHEVSTVELAERQRLIQERVDLEAEVARERKAREDAARTEEIEAERAERKAEIERRAGEPVAGDEKPPAKESPFMQVKPDGKPHASPVEGEAVA